MWLWIGSGGKVQSVGIGDLEMKDVMHLKRTCEIAGCVSECKSHFLMLRRHMESSRGLGFLGHVR